MSDVPQQQTEEVKPLDFTPIEVATTETESKVDEIKPVTEQADTSKPSTATTEEVRDPETVSAGVLGYKAPGLLNKFKFTKRFFWFGNEAIPHQQLSNYLRGPEPKVAQQNAAWSSHTGKGLLYMTKTEAEKSNPQEIMCLADVTDFDKNAHDEFSFKIHGEKHTFKATNDTERDAWYTAIQKAAPEAKASKESVHGSEKYQETLKHLGAGPAAAAGLAVGAKSADKKEDTKEASEVPAAEETAVRANSSTDDEAKADKKDAKSRSISRSKRGSIFGALKGKKEEHNVKTAEKKEEKIEGKEEENKQAAGAAPVDGAAVPAVAVAEETKPVEVEEPVKTEATKPKRNSIFGSIYQKVRSPTVEKKESEAFAPVVPPKDEQLPAKETSEPVVDAPETTPPAATEEPKVIESAPVVAPSAEKTEEKTEATKPKSNFLGDFVERVRAKSPVSRKTEQKKDVVAPTEAPAVPPKDEPVTEPAEQSNEIKPVDAAVVDATKTEEVAAPEAAVTPKDSRRRSYFAGFGQKREKSESEVESEKPAGKFSSMFRKPSQMSRSNTSEKLNKKENVVPESTTVPETVESKPAEATEPSTTGEAVPESITAEKVQHSTPTVSAAA